MEQAIGPTPLIAPFELLAYAAACTERLRLGVAVLISSLHNPLQLAAAVTAVDVTKITRMLEQALEHAPAIAAAKVVGGPARFARDPGEFTTAATVNTAPARPVTR